MSKFERKFGKYAIPNLATVLIVCYAVGYLIQVINSEFLLYLTLDPYQILHGQIWRLFTWVVVPPSIGNLFTTLLMLYFYWSIGNTLERTWGTYRFNVYMFAGMLFTIVGSFVAMGGAYLLYGDAWNLAAADNAKIIFANASQFFSTQYINMSIFLAFASTFPDMQVLLMFIIPIKVKWMGIVYAVLAAWQFVMGLKVNFITVGGNIVTYDFSIFSRIGILASLLNFIVFFALTRKKLMRSPKQIKRQQEFKREVHAAHMVTKHKCAICGRTDESNPELDFRFCSKCNGNYEYCNDHLFTHQHVQ